MNIHWEALLSVFVVALGSAVAVVALVALALQGLRPAAADGPARRSRAATVTTAVCLTLAAGIVLGGLWVIVAK